MRACPAACSHSHLADPIHRATAAGAPVVYVAAGSMLDLTAEQLRCVLGAMQQLPPVRFIWSLKKVRAGLACWRSTA